MAETITSSGIEIDLAAAEAGLLAHPLVLEAVAIGLKDNFIGQALQIYVVLADGVSPSNDLRSELQSVVADHLDGFRPRGLRFAARLPHGADGQPARVAITAVANGRDADDSGLDDPTSLAEIAAAR
jgi:acetyl-CoA synthetase